VSSDAAAVRTIGVLGGGQLGRMMGLAGIPLGYRFLFLDPGAEACAGAAGGLLQARFDDADAARSLAERVDVMTFDFENVPDSTAQAVTAHCPLYPPAAALGACQDRLTEKTLMQGLDVAVGAFHAVHGRADLLAGIERLGYPAVLKTRRLGYDGKGQAMLRDAEDLERAWQRLGDDAPLILEAFIPFEAECSLIGVRGRGDETRFWPLTRNVHAGGILALSRPGGFDDRLQAAAENIMGRLMDHFRYRGVMTIEFFLHRGELLVNEIAPRVHNSGHWTIDGAECSQFENHVRAVAGLPLGGTAMRSQALMFNWIGEMPDRERVLRVEGAHWHDYGKAPRPGRKIGHATVTAASQAQLMERVARVARIAGGDFPALLEQLD